MQNESADLTGLLQAWSRGDGEALALLAALVNEELRRIARRLLAHEQRDGEWRPTELVDEAYLRLLEWHGVDWKNRAHFFGTVAGMMRRVLVDAARARRAAKRGDGASAVPIDGLQIAVPEPPFDVLAIEEALARLEKLNARASRIVELRFFGGFSVEQTAEALSVSVRTVINDWNTARAWLYRELSSVR